MSTYYLYVYNQKLGYIRYLVFIIFILDKTFDIEMYFNNVVDLFRKRWILQSYLFIEIIKMYVSRLLRNVTIFQFDLILCTSFKKWKILILYLD